MPRARQVTKRPHLPMVVDLTRAKRSRPGWQKMCVFIKATDGDEITADGAKLRVEPIFDDSLVEMDGRLVIPTSHVSITDELVQELKDADQE
jgi:hypothetical protein